MKVLSRLISFQESATKKKRNLCDCCLHFANTKIVVPFEEDNHCILQTIVTKKNYHC